MTSTTNNLHPRIDYDAAFCDFAAAIETDGQLARDLLVRVLHDSVALTARTCLLRTLAGGAQRSAPAPRPWKNRERVIAELSAADGPLRLRDGSVTNDDLHRLSCDADAMEAVHQAWYGDLNPVTAAAGSSDSPDCRPLSGRDTRLATDTDIPAASPQRQMTSDSLTRIAMTQTCLQLRRALTPLVPSLIRHLNWMTGDEAERRAEVLLNWILDRCYSGRLRQDLAARSSFRTLLSDYLSEFATGHNLSQERLADLLAGRLWTVIIRDAAWPQTVDQIAGPSARRPQWLVSWLTLAKTRLQEVDVGDDVATLRAVRSPDPADETTELDCFRDRVAAGLRREVNRWQDLLELERDR